MNVIDIAIIVLLGVFIYKDYRKGFTGVLFSLLAIIVGIYLATKLYSPVGAVVQKLVTSKELADIVAFILVFVAINFGINTLGKYFKDLLDTLYLDWLNSILGGFIGFVKGFLLVGAVIMILSYLKAPFIDKELNNSKLAPYTSSLFSKMFKMAANAIPDNIKDKGKNWVDEVIAPKK